MFKYVHRHRYLTMKVDVHLQLDDDVLQKIERDRGLIPRNTFINWILRMAKVDGEGKFRIR